MSDKFKFYFPFCIFIFSCISIFLVSFSYISIVISSLCIIFSFLFFRKRFRLFFLTIFISFSTIITCCFIIYKENKLLLDKYEGINIILGSWIYNNNGGMYIFNNDYTYTQYFSNDTLDYCTGNYTYSYGGIGDDGVIIRQDDNFYYYNLILTEDYCIINNNREYSNNINEMVFSIGKKNNTTLLLDKISETVYILSKVE